MTTKPSRVEALAKLIQSRLTDNPETAYNDGLIWWASVDAERFSP
jgi:hypothetical protein